MRSSLRVAVIATVTALAPAAVAVAATDAAPDAGKPLWQAAHDYYFNAVSPADSAPLPDLRVSQAEKYARQSAEAAKGRLGYPPAAQALAKREQLALKTGKSPRAIAKRAGDAGRAARQAARHSRSSSTRTPTTTSPASSAHDASIPTGCVTEPAGTVFNGPLHNQLPEPGDHRQGHRQQHLLGAELLPGLLRQADLLHQGHHQAGPHGPHGGVDLSGRTVHNYYHEMSKGRYDLGGDVTDWLQVPHSEAWYSADTCEAGEPERSGAPGQPARQRPDGHRRGGRRSPRRSRTSPGPTTTSRTRRTSTTTATSSSPTASSTTWSSSTRATTRPTAAARGHLRRMVATQVVGPATGGFAFPGGTGSRCSTSPTQPEDAGDRRHRARVRPRPRPAGPLRLRSARPTPTSASGT